MTVLPDGLWGAVQTQESGNRPGVPGQPTRYGTPQGLGQMLPSTAQEMAARIGLPWQPALMTAKSPQAANYQSTLGQGYLQQGYDATGNPRDALRYYYGGPNRSMWGPKTNTYADQVLARWNGGQAQPSLASMSSPQQPDPLAPLPGDQPMPPTNATTLAALTQNRNANIPTAAEAFSARGGSGSQPSLGALANGPARRPGKFNIGNILGVFGDAFSAYGGKQPTFGPMLQQEQMMQRQQDFEREKFQNELALRMYIMRNGGLETDVGKKLTSAGIYPGDPRWNAAMATSAANDLDPTVNTAKGPVLRSSVVPQVDPRAISMLREGIAKGDPTVIQEFEQHFGPGSSIRALGGQ